MSMTFIFMFLTLLNFDLIRKAGKIYPYAEHVNTICNDKIKNIPNDFNGKFVVALM